jgi:hypothetical protein
LGPRLVIGFGITDGEFFRMSRPVFSIYLEPLKKNLANKKFLADGDVKQAISFLLQKLDNDLLYARLQAWYHGGTDGLKVNGELVF